MHPWPHPLRHLRQRTGVVSIFSNMWSTATFEARSTLLPVPADFATHTCTCPLIPTDCPCLRVSIIIAALWPFANLRDITPYRLVTADQSPVTPRLRRRLSACLHTSCPTHRFYGDPWLALQLLAPATRWTTEYFISWLIHPTLHTTWCTPSMWYLP